jgi:hypothetical protein
MHDGMRQERFSAMHFLLIVSRFCALQKRVRLTSFNQGRAKALSGSRPVLPNR